MVDTNLTFNLIGNDKSASSSLKGVGDAAEAAAKKLEGARKREESATRRVQIEEARLQELRDSGAKNSQILEQEDFLARTREKAARATELAEKATRELEDAQRDVAKSSADVADALKDVDKAGRDIGDGLDREFKKAGDGAAEFKDEAQSTAREAAASFTGEFDDVADMVQETLANALVGFGPAGAAVGLAAAAGIGLAFAELEKSAEKAAEARERMVELAGAIREAGGDLDRVDWGGRMEDFAAEIGDAKEAWELWQREERTNLEVIAEDTKRLGLEFGDVFKGMAGEPEALSRALSEVDDRLADARAAAQDFVDMGADPFQASIDAGVQELAAYRQKLIDAGATTERATEYAKELTAAIGEQADAMLSASGTALALDSAILDATDAIAENGATLDTNTRAGIENRQALNDIAEAARSVTGTQAEVDAAMSKGREAFLKAARAAGMGADEANRLADELFSLPKNTNVTVKAIIQDPDIRAWQARLQARVNANPVYVPARSAAPIARASGGPVKKDTLYKVGEQGEELFVPSSDGTILNANETRRAKAGASTATVSTGAPLTAEQFETGLERVMRRILAEAQRPASGVRPAVWL